MKHLAVMTCAAIMAMGMLPANASPPPPAPVASAATMDTVFQTLGRKFVDTDLSDGLSLAVVKDGKTWFYNFGSKVHGSQQAPTEQTAYEIASITKVFTSLILAHAVLEGKIDPNADIRKYLPPGYPQLAYGDTPVTVLQLANTTSALPDNLPDISKELAGLPQEKIPGRIHDSWNGYTPEKFLADLKQARIDRKPGTEPRHSNVAAELLGIVLERAYGDSYANLLSRYVEKPLDMRRGTDEQTSAMATGYDEKHAVMPPLRSEIIMPAGGLRYSTADMAKFLAGQLAAKDPAIALSQKATWGNANSLAIGYNWILDRTIDGSRHLRTSGGSFGFSSYIEMYPDKGYGIVLFANRSGQAQNQLRALADAAFKQIFGTPAVLTALHDALEKDDYQHVGNVVTGVRRNYPGMNLTETMINQWGYSLLSAKRNAQAIAMFVYNTQQWPKSANAFDSLGEAYENAGDKDKAITSYRKSLALNPSNEHATNRLKALGGSSK